jgi:hypothetical protein
MSENDFGFSVVDEEEYLKSLSIPPTPIVSTTEDVKKLEEKLDDLLSKVDVDEHKRLVEMEVKDRLKKVEDMILPLLINLTKNPEKIYIKWPNRKDIVDKQIEKLLQLTREY